jgi:AcrR family transcriptional regulator
MGIAERRQEEREQLYRLIADTALDLYIREGPEQLTIRNIAKRINYSPTTIYLYFKDKDHLLLELHDQAFAKLFEFMHPAIEIEEPLHRLTQLGERYIRFGLENPELYDLLFIMHTPMEVLLEDDCKEWVHGKSVFQLLQQTVELCMESGQLPQADAVTLSISIWAHVHGLVSLAIRDRLLVKVPAEEVLNTLRAAMHLNQQFMFNAARFEQIKHLLG